MNRHRQAEKKRARRRHRKSGAGYANPADVRLTPEQRVARDLITYRLFQGRAVMQAERSSREPEYERVLTLSSAVRFRSGKKTSRRTARVWVRPDEAHKVEERAA